MSHAILAVYFVSGLGAVAAEAVWMRWLRELLGATAPAASATLVAFFTGHALGAAWATRRFAHARPTLALYGKLELAAAVGALVVPLLLAIGQWTLGGVYDGVREQPAALALLRVALALGASLPAAFCFGATFPAIAGAVVGDPRALGARAGVLYAVNTLGAAAGTALAAVWLPPVIGVRATYAVAVACLTAAGIAALAIARHAHRETPNGGRPRTSEPEVGQVASERSERAASRRRAKPRKARARRNAEPRRGEPLQLPALRPLGRELGARGLVALSAVAGFGAFALQVLLVQSIAQVSNQSMHAFAAVLIAVLLAIAAAGALVGWLERREWIDPRSLLGIALVAAALALAVFPAWLARATGSFGYVGAASGGIAYFATILVTVLVAAGPALLAVSLVFPAVFAAAGRRAGGPAGAVLGRLVVANTVGAIAGALAAPYLLLANAGLWPSFAALSVLYGLTAVLTPEPGLRGRIRRDGVLAVGWLVVLVRANPLAVPPFALAAGEHALAIDPTPAGVVVVVERDGERLIRVDNHYALGGTAERVHHERQAHLPLLLAPDARRVAYVGSATGISASGALAHPIESLQLVELVPGVARAAERWFGEANRGVYRDARTQVALDDARNFLRWTEERFDVVIADLFVPWQAGTASLYTREHFDAVRAHLLPGGLFCQWLPLYQLSELELRSIAATFRDVFPRAALFRGDFYGRFPIAALVGFVDAPPDPAAVSRAAQRLAAGGVRDRWVTDPVGWAALYVGPLDALAGELATTPRNRDDRPLVEQLAAATHAGGAQGKLDPIVGSRWIAFVAPAVAAAGLATDPIFPSLDAELRRAVEGGAALQIAGADYAAGQVESASRAFATASRLLPPRLITDAAADPTAAELWQDE